MIKKECPHCGHALPKTDYVLLLIIFVIPLALATFSSTKYYPDANSGSVIAVQKSWWGLQQHERNLYYFQAPGYEYRAWNAKNSQGEWFPFVVDE